MIGYDDYQVYLLLSCAPVQGHVAGLVDVGDSRTRLLRKIVDNQSLDTQRLYDFGLADGHFRLRHLAVRAREEDGYGILRLYEYMTYSQVNSFQRYIRQVVRTPVNASPRLCIIFLCT